MKNIRFVGDSIFVPYFLIGVGMLINVGGAVPWLGSRLDSAGNDRGRALPRKWLCRALAAQKRSVSAATTAEHSCSV